MNTENYNRLLDCAKTSLGKYQLYKALDAIRTACQELKQSELLAEEENIRNGYSLMLQFMAQGGNDPQRDSMHQNFLLRACNLLYRMHHQYLMVQGSNRIGEVMRTEKQQLSSDPATYIHALDQLTALIGDCAQGQSASQESLERLYQDLYLELNRFFNYLLTADLFHEEKKQEVIAFLNRIPDIYAGMLLSAIYLNCMEAADLNKIKIIFHFIRSSSVRIKMQALTAFLLLYHRHDSIIRLDETFHNEFLMLKEETEIATDIISIQKQLFLSQETEKASQILNKDILPNMMKSGMGNLNQITQNMDMDSLLQGNLGEMGPMLESNMEHLNKMTRTGYDINYNLFSSMCRNIFFSRFNNWFCYFDPHHPDLADLRKNEQSMKMLETIARSKRLCDLDKYALGYILNHMPEAMRGAMLEGTLQVETEELSVPNPNKEKQGAIRSHIQDLYRFYMKNLQKNNLHSPFDPVPFFGNNQSIMNIVEKGEFLEKMASFFMETEVYDKAQEALLALLEIKSADSWILHSLALTYSYQGAPARALQLEQQAELLDPDNIDILMHIQYLCLELNKHTMRISYLKRIEKKQPLDEMLEIGFVFSLIESGQYEEALKRCYKMKYLEQNLSFANRSIAWCLLQTHKPEEALKYYEKVLEGDDIIWGDYLNAGNAAWINKETNRAIGYYKTFIQEFQKSIEGKDASWTEAFEEEEATLALYDIPEREISMIREIIRPEQE